MSEGELFCGKFTQTAAADSAASAFDSTIEWKSLGSAKNDDLKSIVATTKFQDSKWQLCTVHSFAVTQIFEASLIWPRPQNIPY